MPFSIENWYCYLLKISESRVHQLKEGHLKELNDSIYQKVLEIAPEIITDLLLTF